MRIGIVTPAPPNSRSGNRITALRWAKILRQLGNRVSILHTYDGTPYDLLVALHARLSYPSIIKFRRQLPHAQIIVALTGTDLYHQSNGRFDVCVIGHLRVVKDPFRTALAARLLPNSSRIRILQIGRAMTDAMAAEARKEMRANPRYEWLGELPRSHIRRILAKSRLSVVASRIEGGANVVSEAITASVPILASRIDGNVGILGADYPGLFEMGDTQKLAQLLARAETNRKYLAELRERCQKLAPLFYPAREEKAWADLISELFLIESE